MSSIMGSRGTYRCGIHELSDVGSDSLANAESRAQEQHERRLARIVVDQWMHVARKRLTLAWCAQMVHCWHKICSKSTWTRQQTYLASEHHNQKKFLNTFNAFCEGSRKKQRNQSAAAKFYKENLEKKALRSLFKAQSKYWRHHERQCLTKAIQVVKNYHEKEKETKRMYKCAQLFYDTSLKKQVFNSLFKHRKHLQLKLSHQVVASYHWKKHMKAKTLKCWGIIAKRISDFKNKVDKSRVLFLESLLKRCMENWLFMTNETVHARQDKVVQASQTFDTSLKKRMLQAWAQHSWKKQTRCLNLEQAAMMHIDRTFAVVMNAWRDYLVEKEESRAKTSMAFNLKRKEVLFDAITVWKVYQEKKLKMEGAVLKALAHLKQILTLKSLIAWKCWHKKRTSKKQDKEKALKIYKYLLHWWTSESILAVGLMLHPLQLPSKERVWQSLPLNSYTRVAPYARKWWFISQKRSNLRKVLLHRKQKEDVPLSNNKEPLIHEILLRIEIDKDDLKIQHERPASSTLEMMKEPHKRPQPRGRALLPPPTPTPLQTSTVIRQRLIPRRPAFLSFPLSL